MLLMFWNFQKPTLPFSSKNLAFNLSVSMLRISWKEGNVLAAQVSNAWTIFNHFRCLDNVDLSLLQELTQSYHSLVSN